MPANTGTSTRRFSAGVAGDCGQRNSSILSEMVRKELPSIMKTIRSSGAPCPVCRCRVPHNADVVARAKAQTDTVSGRRNVPPSGAGRHRGEEFQYIRPKAELNPSKTEPPRSAGLSARLREEAIRLSDSGRGELASQPYGKCRQMQLGRAERSRCRHPYPLPGFHGERERQRCGLSRPLSASLRSAPLPQGARNPSSEASRRPLAPSSQNSGSTSFVGPSEADCS